METTATAQDPRFAGVTFVSAMKEKPVRFVPHAMAVSPASRPLASPSAIEESPSSDPESLALARWVLRRAGLDPDSYRPEPLLRRATASLRILRAGSPAQAREIVARHPGELSRVLDCLLIGVSGFFRDPHVFDALSDTVLPELLRRRLGIRVWSAGCSDGSELSSVAVLLHERGALTASTLLGTDCRANAIASARAGCFRCGVGYEIPARVERYLVPGKDGWVRLAPEIRTAPRFEISDALEDDPPGPFDLILCRNLAIYLSHDAASRLWQQLSRRLAPDGYLVTGKAEQIRSAGLARVAPSLYRRTKGSSS